MLIDGGSKYVGTKFFLPCDSLPHFKTFIEYSKSNEHFQRQGFVGIIKVEIVLSYFGT